MASVGLTSASERTVDFAHFCGLIDLFAGIARISRFVSGWVELHSELGSDGKLSGCSSVKLTGEGRGDNEHPPLVGDSTP